MSVAERDVIPGRTMDDVARAASLLGDGGVLDTRTDPGLAQALARLARDSAATWSALSVVEGVGAVVAGVWQDGRPVDGGGRLPAGEQLQTYLLRRAGARPAGSVVAEHEVLVDGRPLGSVAMLASGRATWSPEDLAALAECARALGADLEARVARAEVHRIQRLVSEQNEIHRMIGRGAPLHDVLTAICEAIARYDDALMPTVLRRDPESNTLRSGVGPLFPPEYHAAVEGAPIGPSIGTCGPAAWFGELTISENLEEDPNWAPIIALPRMVGVNHCWSMPAKDADGEVLGTLAFYGRGSRRPTPEHLTLLEDWAWVVATAIEQAGSRERLTHDARHDGLTGLPNRTASLERLTHAVQRALPDRRVAIFFIDLDGLKAMNDTLGHDVADDMLRTMATRFARTVRGGDFVGRYGGDEFVVVAEGIREVEEAATIGERLVEVAAQPLTGLTSMPVTASIGIALVHSSDTDPREALREADEAMYRAKRAGKDRCVFADLDLAVPASRRTQLARALRAVENRDELEVAYRPVVHVPDRQVSGLEALLSWNSLELGAVSREELLSVAEDTGRIVPIGGWMLREACEHLGRGDGDLDLHVRLSARQVAHPELTMLVRQVLTHAEFPPQRLVFTVTESALGGPGDPAVASLRELQELGVRIALAGVGAEHFPVRWLYDGLFAVLRLDRRLVARLGDERDRAITGNLVAAAHAAGCAVLADGVETLDEERHLRALGVDQAQGPLLDGELIREGTGPGVEARSGAAP